MKEIEAIQMRKDLENLKEYGFTYASIGRYVSGVSESAIRRFMIDHKTLLHDEHHTVLKSWIEETTKTINDLVHDPINNLTDKEKEELKTWLHNKKVNDALMKIIGNPSKVTVAHQADLGSVTQRRKK
jgi:predicted ATP-dependent endonuclease of OLD family